MLDEYTKNLLHEDTTISQFINPVDVQEICQNCQYFSSQQNFVSLRNEIEITNRLISKERRNLAKTKTIDAIEEKLTKKQFSEKNNSNETKREAVVVVS
jgi:hypothetical protein